MRPRMMSKSLLLAGELERRFGWELDGEASVVP
jgi:hypothetical protein